MKRRRKTKGRLCLAFSLLSACWFIHVDILCFSAFPVAFALFIILRAVYALYQGAINLQP